MINNLIFWRNDLIGMKQGLQREKSMSKKQKLKSCLENSILPQLILQIKILSLIKKPICNGFAYSFS
jgi:hypothetical protein